MLSIIKMKKLLFVLLFICSIGYSQQHFTGTLAADTLTLTALINTAYGSSLYSMAQLYGEYHIAIYALTDTATVFFNSTNTIRRTVRAGVFTYLGTFSSASYPDLWLAGAGRVDIDIWKNK
jgi:uncharacterized RmlC-like cupin family protein